MELNIKFYYEKAKSLRIGLLGDNENAISDCYARIQKHPLWCDSSREDLQLKKFSLNEIKQVVALEFGYPSWVELKIDCEYKISQIQENCDGVFIIGDCDYDAGDVVNEDIVYLGSSDGLNFAVDMETQLLYEVKVQEEKLGVILKHRDEGLEENEKVVEPPDDENWSEWSIHVLKQYFKNS